MKKTVLMMIAAVLVAGTVAQAADAFVFQSYADLIATDGAAGTRIYGVTWDSTTGTVYYNLNTSTGSSVVKVESDGSSSTLFSNSSGDGWTNSLLSGYYGMSVSADGSYLIWTESKTDSVWVADTTTGAVTQVKDTDDIAAYTGVSNTSGNPSSSVASFTIASDGSLTFYEGASDSILNVTLDGTLTTVTDFSDASYEGTAGKVNSGMVYDSAGNLYFADSDTDCMYCLNADGTFATVLTTSEIAAVTGVSTVYINDIIIGDDGTIYFADRESGTILAYDADSDLLTLLYDASSLDDVSAARELTFYSDETGDYVLFHDWQSDVYAVAVPEPMTLLLLGFGGLSVMKRKRKKC